MKSLSYNANKHSQKTELDKKQVVHLATPSVGRIIEPRTKHYFVYNKMQLLKILSLPSVSPIASSHLLHQQASVIFNIHPYPFLNSVHFLLLLLLRLLKLSFQISFPKVPCESFTHTLSVFFHTIPYDWNSCVSLAH